MIGAHFSSLQCQAWLRVRIRWRAAETLGLPATLLRRDPPFAGTCTRPRGDSWTRHRESRAELLDQPFDGQLAVSELAPLVLGDGPQHRPCPPDYTPLLNLRQDVGRLDIEHRLDARRGLLSMLTSRSARPRDPHLNLRKRQRDGARDPNRLTLHGLHSARHRRCAPRVRRTHPGRRGRGCRAPPHRPPSSVCDQQLDPSPRAPRRGAAPDGFRAGGRRAADDPGRRCP